MRLRQLFAASTALALIGCAAPVMPPSPGYLKEEAPKPASGAIPAPVQLPVAPPRPQPAAKAETYSVVVNNVRVHELLFALARDAKLNIDIHPGITGAVTLNAIDQTLPQLLNRISKQVDMRYEIEGPNLIVMPDTPFLRVYKIDYVNMIRDTSGDVSVSAEIAGGGGATSAAGGATAAGGGGGANVSSLKIKNVSNNRFWPTLVENVKEILRETDKILPASGAAAAPVPPPAPAGSANQPANAQATAAVPVPSVTFREAASVISNPEAGVLFIRASSRQHEKIREFLDRVLTNARRQVLIETTIVEVLLSNQYQQGIDWSYIGSHLKIGQFSGPAAAATPPNLTALTGPVFALAYSAGNFNSLVKLLESFGTTRIISSPRISTLNNQTAVLKVVENVVYFLVQSQQSQTANAPNLTTVTTTPQTVPVGLVMNITPQISDDDTILLNIKPSISVVTDNIRDPNPTLTIENTVPQIATREMESVLKLANGQIAVMGGLIQDRVENQDDTLPGVNRVPVLGNLFAQRNLKNSKSELVIFLRPIVVHDPSIDGDFRSYRVFLPNENFLNAPNPGRPMLPDTQVQ